MPAKRNLDLETKIRSLLEFPVRTKDGLAKLFCSLLGFEYVGRAFSNRDNGIWGEGEVARVAADQSFEILSRHGDVAAGGFAIVSANAGRSICVGRKERLNHALHD